MAKLQITALSNIKSFQKEAIFTDIHLDLETGYSQNNKLFGSNEIRDLRVDVNLHAINNSISNLFNTCPGQRILDPQYGLDLKQYLFTQVSTDMGQLIATTISSGIAQYEPRINLQQIQVVADDINNQYLITLQIIVNVLKNVSPGTTSASIIGSINTNGFQFLK